MAFTPTTVFLGNYGDAILAADFDPRTGELRGERAVASLKKASFLARSANARHLYAVSETGSGTLHAFAITPEFGLTALNTVSTDGAAPCDVALSPDGRLVAVANYTGGSVGVWRIEADGYLGAKVFFNQHAHAANIFPGRQKAAHAHGVTWSRDGRLLLVPDLGGDRVYLYACDPAAGTLAPNPAQAWLEMPPGAGPRHAQFSPDGRHLYIINELGNTLSAAAYDAASGTLSLIETVSTLPPDGYPGPTKTAEVVVSADGRFVYGSNRGADTIVWFARDTATGRLTRRGEVAVPAHPRHFALSPDGVWLLSAGMDADKIAVFSISPENGEPKPAGHSLSMKQPVCIRF